MCIAVIIMGHSNWGKTTIVKEILDIKSLRGISKAKIIGFDTDFVIRSMSNDDVNMEKYVEKINKLPQECNLLTCICPKDWPDNSVHEILKKYLRRFKDIYCFIIEYQWNDEIKIVDVQNLKCKLEQSLSPKAIDIKIIGGKHGGDFKQRVAKQIKEYLSKKLG